MKKYLSLFGMLLLTALIGGGVASCTNTDESVGKKSEEYNMSIDTRALPANVVSTMQLQMFHRGGTYDQMFQKNLLYTETAGILRSQVEPGNWNLTMVSPPSGTVLTAPVGSVRKENMPMYKYSPTVVANKSTNAAEIYTALVDLPNMVAGNAYNVSGVKVARNVAKVEVAISSATPNFLTAAGTAHKITLHNIPSTITYAGTLYPNATTPDTLSKGLEARLTMKPSTVNVGYYDSEQVDFIIPAHKGTSASDTVKVKMAVTVELLRTGGTSWFKKTKIIPVTAKCNEVLHVDITVSDGMEFTTTVKPWDEVDISTIVGEGYTNWVYVKKGSTGSGQSWRDATGTISGAVAKAQMLKTAGYTVNGILVAGGGSYVYDEGFTVPAGIRVFGGWIGTPGTELGSGDINGPYTAATTVRNLKTHKTKLNPPVMGQTARIFVNGTGAMLDGFIVDGITAVPAPEDIIRVDNSAVINAVQVTNISSTSAISPLSVLGGSTASNVLVADNSRGISVFDSKLINATIANNASSSNIFNATILNSIFWRSTTDLTGTNDIRYSAFVGEIGTIPSGTGNIHINQTNTAWFSTAITAPGPHFKLTNDSERYKAVSNRAPMLGRGNESIYSTSLSALLNKDIEGNPRFKTDPLDHAKKIMDIGCYEDISGLTGFRLTWASDRLYISAKGGYVSNLPLMLPGNADPATEIAVNWNVSVTPLAGATSWSTYNGTTINTTDNVVVGTLKFTNYGVTPGNDYTGTADRQWGTAVISTTLGGYLPNTTVEIWQVPGASSPWKNGYVGSFHRNNERGARYITGQNTGATHWEARIVSGLEWIKIDAGEKYDGVDITDPDEGRTPENRYYKEVDEVWGGALTARTGGIKFRVGMKSKNTTGQPRYGLIVITRGTLNTTTGRVTGGTAMFFVRQGEDDDFLYRPEDPRDNGRSEAKRWSPFSLTAPSQHTADITNANRSTYDLGPRGGGFVSHPSKIGYFFQRNGTVPYLRGAQTTVLPSPAPSSAANWNAALEVCPPGYRHASFPELLQSLYLNTSPSQGSNNSASATGASLYNFVWGRYADGYYDQLAPDPVPPLTIVNTTTPVGSAVDEVGTPPNVAMKGILMVNHFNYAAIFFPQASTLPQNNPSTYYGQPYPGTDGYSTTTMFYASTPAGGNTHWVDGHIGLTCTSITNANGAVVRCVVE